MLQYQRNRSSAIRGRRRSGVMGIAAAAGLLLALGIAGAGLGCGGSETAIYTPAPLPTPTAQPASLLYAWFQDERERNPVRFDKIMDEKGVYGFTGIVSKIDGTKVQFHLARRAMKKDDYVECQFEELDDVLAFSIGDTITLYGNIVEVGRILKFEECRVE